MSSRWCGRAAAVAAAVLAAGCGGEPAGPVVRGRVALDGKPLADAQVQFVAADGGTHVTKTDADGRFTLTQAAKNVPLQPGPYAVLVSKVSGANDPNLPGGGMETQKDEVPPAYQDRAHTPLKADVGEGTTELPPFELTSKPRR